MLVTLHGWGSKHVYRDETAGFDMIHATCGQSLQPRLACSCCGEMVNRRDIQLTREENCPTVGEVMPKDAVSEEAA